MAPRTPETIREYPLERIDSDIHDYYRNIAAVVNGEAEPIVTHDQQRELMRLMEPSSRAPKRTRSFTSKSPYKLQKSRHRPCLLFLIASPRRPVWPSRCL